VLCERCGSENSEINRFCGMCGGPLTPKPVAAPPPTRPAAVPVAKGETRGETGPMPAMANTRPSLRPSSEATRVDIPPEPPAAVPVPVPVQADDDGMYDPVISGPSFLGLNKPRPRSSSRIEEDQITQSHLEPRDQYSSNLDYLLEDEQQSRRGWGKFAAVVIALALLGGFGYLRWKQGGFDWLLKSQKPGQSADATPGTTDSAKNDTGTTTPANDAGGMPTSNATAPAPATNATEAGGATDNSTPAAASGPPANGTDVGTPPNTAAPNTAAPVQPLSQSAASNNSVNNPAGSTPSNPTSNRSSAAEGSSGDSSDANSATSKPASGTGSDETTSAPAAHPDPQKIREPKPTPVTQADPTAEAERYAYGRGVAQDCDRGLRLLKPAAAHSNVKAMIALGSLYSSGTCAPRDLPTAYRYFSLALRLQPDNQPVQNDLQGIWAKMTQPERQLAIKLSH
jgi:hypothetical protein